MCDLETSRIGAPYIYDISNLRANHSFLHPFVLENKYKQINSCQKHKFIKIISYSATCFNPLGSILRQMFETL
jgi:hypothetical protein